MPVSIAIDMHTGYYIGSKMGQVNLEMHLESLTLIKRCYNGCIEY